MNKTLAALVFAAASAMGIGGCTFEHRSLWYMDTHEKVPPKKRVLPAQHVISPIEMECVEYSTTYYDSARKDGRKDVVCTCKDVNDPKNQYICAKYRK